jgi:hypothetical protein
MKSRKVISPSSVSKAKIARLQRQMAAARRQADKLRSAARKAKADLKRVRKSFKQAKRAAKGARKKIKAWKKMLLAAQEFVSAAGRTSKPARSAAKPKAKSSTRRVRRRLVRSPSSVPPETTSAALSLGEQYSSGATLGGAAKYSPATAASGESPREAAPPEFPTPEKQD